MLLDSNYQIVGVIDWECSYAAPNEFTYAPPWWLLLEQPEYWKECLDSWTAAYAERLPTFLEAMTEREDIAIAAGKLREDQWLSGRMSATWATGELWSVYAAQKSFAFDSVYWKEIDARFFGSAQGDAGPEDVWKQRLGLLDERARAAMDGFVEKKMAEMETRVLAWDPDEYTLQHQAAQADEGKTEDGL